MVVNGATASSAIRMRVNTSAQSSIRAKTLLGMFAFIDLICNYDYVLTMS
jgi:hypothetical protein